LERRALEGVVNDLCDCLDRFGRGGLGVEAALGQAHAAHVQARPIDDGGGIVRSVGRWILARNEFGGAPAHVHYEAGSRKGIERRAGRGEAPRGLVAPRQDLDGQAQLALHAIEHRLPVGGVAEGARADSENLLRPMCVSGSFVLAERREQPVLRGIANLSAGVDALAQPYEPLSSVKPTERIPGRLDHQELRRVGADVDRRDGHGR
jgi:hypothetical protein